MIKINAKQAAVIGELAKVNIRFIDKALMNAGLFGDFGIVAIKLNGIIRMEEDVIQAEFLAFGETDDSYDVPDDEKYYETGIFVQFAKGNWTADFPGQCESCTKEYYEGNSKDFVKN
jgi:hypothetical protein